MRLLVPFGTRPEIVKLAPVVRALRAAGDEVVVVATGQHHDADLTDVFYAELGVAPGNPVLDALRGSGVVRRPLAERSGVVLTAHRATNVDDPAQLVALVHGLAAAVGPVVFPVHPRTRRALEAAGRWADSTSPA